MKHFAKIIGISMVVMFAVMMLSSGAFAGSGSPQIDPSAPPPHGIVMHGDAKGVKLYGSISVEYIGYHINCPSAACAVNSKAVLQLQTAKGDIIRTFVEEIPDLPYDANLQIDTLILAFKSAILSEFFKGENVSNIVLVSLGEYQPTPPDAATNYMIASITLAVN